MTLTEIVRKGKGTAGSGGSWRVVDYGEGILQLWHYSTLMLEWDTSGVRYTDTGHGSVSDQNGMNKAFRALGVPFYYSRRGGATITEVAR